MLSIKLTQFVWRKLCPDERDQADSELNDTAYELLLGEDYKLAERILDYGINHTGPGGDLARRMMIVNYANAFKLGGNKKRAEEELAKYDWTATNLAFQICVAAVKDDTAEVAKLMPAAVKSGDVTEEALRRWPAFRTVRNEKSFQEKFRDLFDKDLISVVPLTTERAPQPTPSSDEDSRSDATPLSRDGAKVTRH